MKKFKTFFRMIVYNFYVFFLILFLTFASFVSLFLWAGIYLFLLVADFAMKYFGKRKIAKMIQKIEEIRKKYKLSKRHGRIENCRFSTVLIAREKIIKEVEEIIKFKKILQKKKKVLGKISKELQEIKVEIIFFPWLYSLCDAPKYDEYYDDNHYLDEIPLSLNDPFPDPTVIPYLINTLKTRAIHADPKILDKLVSNGGKGYQSHHNYYTVHWVKKWGWEFYCIRGCCDPAPEFQEKFIKVN